MTRGVKVTSWEKLESESYHVNYVTVVITEIGSQFQKIVCDGDKLKISWGASSLLREF